MERGKSRKIGIPLTIGIIFLPVIFAWFLLREGYSARARVISFAWAAVLGVQMAIGISQERTAPSQASSAPETSEESAAEKLRTRTALAAGHTLKAAMRNPDSLIIEQALASDDGTLLCVSYRGQNGFGGMNRDKIAFKQGVPHTQAAYWNKHCAVPLNDVTSTVELGAKLSR